MNQNQDQTPLLLLAAGALLVLGFIMLGKKPGAEVPGAPGFSNMVATFS